MAHTGSLSAFGRSGLVLRSSCQFPCWGLLSGPSRHPTGRPLCTVSTGGHISSLQPPRFRGFALTNRLWAVDVSALVSRWPVLTSRSSQVDGSVITATIRTTHIVGSVVGVPIRFHTRQLGFRQPVAQQCVQNVYAFGVHDVLSLPRAQLGVGVVVERNGAESAQRIGADAMFVADLPGVLPNVANAWSARPKDACCTAASNVSLSVVAIAPAGRVRTERCFDTRPIRAGNRSV